MVAGGLRLKREVIQSAPLPPTGEFSVAKVWVDSSVYHLDSSFTYLIPGNLSDSVFVGSSVVVPFHGRELEGVVQSLGNPESITGLKSISKVIGSIPLLSQEVIALIAAASSRYAAHPFDLIRSALPDRVASVERNFRLSEMSEMRRDRKRRSEFLQLPPHKSRSQLMAEKIRQLSLDGSVLVVLPDAQEVERLHRALDLQGLPHAQLTSSQARSEHFENFLKVRTGESSIVIGTRSAVFAPVKNLQSLLIFNEGSEHLYEKRSPGWNARDIAFLRAEYSHLDIYFIGYSPSGDIASLIQSGSVNHRRVRAKMKVRAATPTHGELLPSSALTPIKSALKAGPVLVLVPTKGFAQAIRCSQCKTISRCECGGALEKRSVTASVSCNHCLSMKPQWRCAWCQSEVFSLAARGIERHQQEIGLLFPGIPTYLATADHPLSEVINHGIIITTPGMAPENLQGYAALVIVEGDRFLNQPDLRASERVREMLFTHSALVREGGEVLIIAEQGHSIVTALTTWNPLPIVERELTERLELNLPPYVRSASLTMESSEISRLKSALETARQEARLPQSVRILGPITSGEKSTLVLSAALSEGDLLISTIHEFMRRRSAGKKSLPQLRIDPYSLSH